MSKKFFALFLISILFLVTLSACASDSAELVEPEIDEPTATEAPTDTPTPTNTATPIPTETLTPTPSPTPTETPIPYFDLSEEERLARSQAYVELANTYADLVEVFPDYEGGEEHPTYWSPTAKNGRYRGAWISITTAGPWEEIDMYGESFYEEKPDAAYLLDIEEMVQDIHGQGSLI